MVALTAASRAPQIECPAKGVVATVSETNAIVCVVPVRRLRETALRRWPVSRRPRAPGLDSGGYPHLLAAAA